MNENKTPIIAGDFKPQYILRFSTPDKEILSIPVDQPVQAAFALAVLQLHRQGLSFEDMKNILSAVEQVKLR